MTSRAGHEPVLSCPGSALPGFRKPVAVREILEFRFCADGMNIIDQRMNAAVFHVLLLRVNEPYV